MESARHHRVFMFSAACLKTVTDNSLQKNGPKHHQTANTNKASKKQVQKRWKFAKKTRRCENRTRIKCSRCVFKFKRFKTRARSLVARRNISFPSPYHTPFLTRSCGLIGIQRVTKRQHSWHPSLEVRDLRTSRERASSTSKALLSFSDWKETTVLFALSVITAGEGISQITSAMSSTMFFNCVSSRNQLPSLFSMNVTNGA